MPNRPEDRGANLRAMAQLGASEAPVPASAPATTPRTRRLAPVDGLTSHWEASGGRRGFVLRRLLALSDLIALVAAYGAVMVVRALAERAPALPQDTVFYATTLLLWVVLATVFKTYHVGDRSLDYSLADEIGPIFLVATVWNWLVLIGTAAVSSGPVEILPAVTLWVASFVLVLGLRAVVIGISRHTRWYRQRVLVIGSPADAARVVRRIDRHPEYGLDLVATATLAEAGEATEPEPGVTSSRVLAREPGDVVQLAEQVQASRAIVASVPVSLEGRSELIRGLTEARIQVDLVSGEPDLCSSSAASLHYVEGLPVLTVPSVQTPGSWLVVKRSIDVVVSLVGMVLLSPLVASVALAVRLDSRGPVFFRQRRTGRDGHTFGLLKFRTMVEGADDMKSTVASLNMHAVGDARMFKVQSDPRVTRVGAWLRRWSLDELPQLWNVLVGDMSLVGPRPLIPEEARRVEGRYEVRLRMRPGITGPWQTLGRSDIGFEDMIKLDYTYVMNWTLAEDLKLLMRTAAAVVRARGAY